VLNNITPACPIHISAFWICIWQCLHFKKVLKLTVNGSWNYVTRNTYIGFWEHYLIFQRELDVSASESFPLLSWNAGEAPNGVGGNRQPWKAHAPSIGCCQWEMLEGMRYVEFDGTEMRSRGLY
jgi:hypothetical protein